MNPSPVRMLLALIGVLTLVGCEAQTSKPTTNSAPVLGAEPLETQQPLILPSELRRKLKVSGDAQFRRVGNDIVSAIMPRCGVQSIEPLEGLPLLEADLGLNPISDISPLQGMPLTSLILENCPIDDISVLKGMPLEILYLQNTQVTDLSVLKGMPLRQLNLLAVPVSDISMMSDFPLDILWLPKTKVTDISALASTSLVSLDIEGTGVTDLTPLASVKTLQRLNIAQTPVTDVSPLAGLSLKRITLSPETITKGMEVLRAMPELSEIRQSMEGQTQTADTFWQKYDEGVWASEQKETP